MQSDRTRLTRAAYRAEHRQELADKQRARYWANIDAASARQAAYRAAHRSELATKQRARNAAHRAARAADKAAYNAAHQDELSAKKAAAAAARREKHRTARRAHYAANREAYLRAATAYKAAHPHLQREHEYRRRTRKRAGFVAPVSATAIYARDRGICQICGKAVKAAEASLDHIVPLAAGGSHEPRNVQLAHRACNNRRQHRGPAQTRLF